VGHQLGCGWRT